MIAPLSALLRLFELDDPEQSPGGGKPAERERILVLLPPDALARYHQAVRKHGRSAMLPIDRHSCGGCHMRVPAHPREVIQDVFECEHCHRLLYDAVLAYELTSS